MSQLYNSTNSIYSSHEFSTPRSSGVLPLPKKSAFKDPFAYPQDNPFEHPLSKNARSESPNPLTNPINDSSKLQKGVEIKDFIDDTHPAYYQAFNSTDNRTTPPPHIPTPVYNLEPIPEMQLYPRKRGIVDRLFECLFGFCQCSGPRKPQVTYFKN